MVDDVLYVTPLFDPSDDDVNEMEFLPLPVEFLIDDKDPFFLKKKVVCIALCLICKNCYESVLDFCISGFACLY